ncbi:class F sortase [Nocardioides sp. SYSU D00065]|uniref:class F sortase n=1 Tax=Nocardioides sp. SYSU D00065 TaxID=2817378 RepID=UPI001B319850|nr:class F sortase [Nocardioides sp. SYSU D00065]
MLLPATEAVDVGKGNVHMDNTVAARRRHRAALLLVVPVLLAGFLHPGAGAAAPAKAASAPAASGPRCTTADRPFTPTSLRIDGVVGPTRVLALGRDRNGVPRTPPLTDRGKWQLGWDRISRIRPGSERGVVRLTAHTYPWSGAYGLALGNRLLTSLRNGARITVEGPAGQRMCYRVTKITRVPAGQIAQAYYTSTGRPRLAILVCSGVRRGPGDWSHRTIWFAEPI